MTDPVSIATGIMGLTAFAIQSRKALYSTIESLKHNARIVPSIRFSFRDFFISTSKGKDIAELRSLLAAYKSTIVIALADANIQQVNITAKLRRENKQTTDDTTSDLHELFRRCSEAPQGPSPRVDTAAQSDEIESSDIAEEKASIEECLMRTDEEFDSIKQCLSICQEATEQVTNERINGFGDVSMADDGGSRSLFPPLEISYRRSA
ncbi:hypothetical protein LTR70_010512 [Exophiala xenobiotica]|uniref:Azaphilone pigments biosynthesis cluster protein L N-terminal domain-containing protein n=1 Tax=Lithohypha guttulata TaxID=1690604 RepID=A0ABR0JTR2_9EURO|nr:hypothetical protein LTR24_010496 [Lithohypha guttulata]KAK5309208.1 hypothetical protein LTR70_010512 [Exophiala xenobiotica]